MAVTIDDMQVDVDKPQSANTPAPAAPAVDTSKLTNRYDLHQELKMRAQRELRLKAD